MKIGQRGLFRMWGTIAPGMPATVQGHQDTGFLSVQAASGKYVTFSPDNGTVIGEADVAGAWERVTFDGGNILVAQPNGGQGGVALPYEWFNL